MAYQKVMICGETEELLDEGNRYIAVKTDAGVIVLHCEDDQSYVETRLEVAEALELVRVLTDAIGDLT